MCISLSSQRRARPKWYHRVRDSRGRSGTLHSARPSLQTRTRPEDLLQNGLNNSGHKVRCTGLDWRITTGAKSRQQVRCPRQRAIRLRDGQIRQSASLERLKGPQSCRARRSQPRPPGATLAGSITSTDGQFTLDERSDRCLGPCGFRLRLRSCADSRPGELLRRPFRPGDRGHARLPHS